VSSPSGDGAGIDLAAIFGALHATEVTAAWLDRLEAGGDPPVELALPPRADLPGLLRELGVTDEDAVDLIGSLAVVDGAPDLWRLVERSAWLIVSGMGGVSDWPVMPRWPGSTGLVGRVFYAWVFLAALPFARRFHAERGIPAEVSRATFADLGRSLRHGRRQVDGLAVADPWWLERHLRGALYQLGRLQFERGRLGNTTSHGMIAAGVDCSPGDHVLSLHIPAYSGPMDPAACDASIAWALEFFPRHFPEERFVYAVCYSWMLDDDLREYLPATSNIIRFLDRFQIAYRFEENDASILRFVFGRSDLPLDDYPQTTTLERAVIAHIKAGRHWHGGAGWFALPTEG
jgi:hypothetical protein